MLLNGKYSEILDFQSWKLPLMARFIEARPRTRQMGLRGEVPGVTKGRTGTSMSLIAPVDIMVCESIVWVRVSAPTLLKVEFGDIGDVGSSSRGKDGTGLVLEIWLAWDGVGVAEREE